jgi:hypothetical protein
MDGSVKKAYAPAMKVIAVIGIVIVALVLLGFMRALFLRYRQKRQTSQAWRQPAKAERIRGARSDINLMRTDKRPPVDVKPRL